MKIKLLLLSAICMMSFASCCHTHSEKGKVVASEPTVEQPKKEKTVIVARVKVKDGKEADFLKIALPLVEATNQEEGNLYYELYQSSRDSKTFIFYEEYIDDDAFAMHASSEHFKKFEQALPDIIAEDLKVDKF